MSGDPSCSATSGPDLSAPGCPLAEMVGAGSWTNGLLMWSPFAGGIVFVIMVMSDSDYCTEWVRFKQEVTRYYDCRFGVMPVAMPLIHDRYTYCRNWQLEVYDGW